MTDGPASGVDASGPPWVARVRAAPGPSVVMLCGMTGSGKTTLARSLERDLPALRLSVDPWMIALFGEHMQREVFDVRAAKLMEIAWDVALRTTSLGVHVVLDWGFWRRAERVEAAERVRTAGATPLLVFLDVPLAALERRLVERNAAPSPERFTITSEMLAEFAPRFEPPTDEEGIDLVRLTG